jgi:hypothetical protein
MSLFARLGSMTLLRGTAMSEVVVAIENKVLVSEQEGN